MDALPLGIRLCNPGCVRRPVGVDHIVGMEGDFPHFHSMADGLTAQANILHTYYFDHRLTTVPQIVARYAPAAENDVAKYVASLVNLLGFDPSNYATRDVGFGRSWNIAKFMLAQHRVECGVPPPDWRASPHWCTLQEMADGLKATQKWPLI